MSYQGLGGQIVGKPSVIAYGNTIHVFARGVDNQLAHTWFDGNTWFPWESLGGILRSDPVAVTYGIHDQYRSIYVFALGADNSVHFKKFFGEWGAWQYLGGAFDFAPQAIMSGQGRLDVFIRGRDNALWHNWITAAGDWRQSIGGWESLGGVLASNPAVSIGQSSSLHAFVRGTDNGLHHKWFDSTGWHDWQYILGGMASAPAIVYTPKSSFQDVGGHTYIAYLNSTGTLVCLMLADDGGVHPQDSRGIGGTFNSLPSLVSWSSGRIDMFIRSSSNELLHSWLQELQGYTTLFHPWESLEGYTFGDPVAVSGNSTYLDVFVEFNHGLLRKWYREGEGWRP